MCDLSCAVSHCMRRDQGLAHCEARASAELFTACATMDLQSKSRDPSPATWSVKTEVCVDNVGWGCQLKGKAPLRCEKLRHAEQKGGWSFERNNRLHNPRACLGSEGKMRCSSGVHCAVSLLYVAKNGWKKWEVPVRTRAMGVMKCYKNVGNASTE